MNFYNKIEYNKRLNAFKVDIYLKSNKTSLINNDDDIWNLNSIHIY